MKQVHWYDDPNIIPSAVHNSMMSTLNASPLSESKRVEMMSKKVDDVFRRMDVIRLKIRQLSQEMDDQLEETRHTNDHLIQVRRKVNRMFKETVAYDQELKAFYEYEKLHSRRRM
jgi:septal ring factor EnvC (AmiA/AmiB activator)